MKEERFDYSDEKAYRVAYLVAGYIRKTLTEAEHDELDAWVEASDSNMLLFEELTDEKNLEANLAWMDEVQTEKALASARQQLVFTNSKTNSVRKLWPYMAAASLIIGIVLVLLLRPDSNSGGTQVTQLASNDAAPGSSRATLTLGNGNVVDLGQEDNGIIQIKTGTKIEKKGDGLLMYEKVADTKEANINTLSIPRGGQYALTLSDGTKVWLNALSSLRFPEQFTGGERVVELNGEAFFEVAKDKKHPFIVQLSDDEAVKVLGTVFNVSTYPNDGVKKITLVEGSVEVRGKRSNLHLAPGQQAQIANGNLQLQKHADIEAATGWKNEVFIFHDADVYNIMRQAERWYDVNVIYRTTHSEHFNFTISRNEPLSKILHLMELTGKIHFKIENKNVYVLP